MNEKVNVLKGTSEFFLEWIEWAAGKSIPNAYLHTYLLNILYEIDVL